MTIRSYVRHVCNQAFRFKTKKYPHFCNEIVDERSLVCFALSYSYKIINQQSNLAVVNMQHEDYATDLFFELNLTAKASPLTPGWARTPASGKCTVRSL